MFDLTNIRMETEKTYTPLPSILEQDIVYVLECNNITDYEFYSKRRAKDIIPQEIYKNLPDKMPRGAWPPDLKKTQENYLILISHMNSEDIWDLAERIDGRDGYDPDLYARKKAEQERAHAAYLREQEHEYRMKNDKEYYIAHATCREATPEEEAMFDD